MHKNYVWLWIFSDIFWENILWAVNIGTKFEIIDLPYVTFVQILSD